MTITSVTMSEAPNKPSIPSTNEPTPETGIRLTEQQLRARRARSIAIAWALFAFVIVIFLVTLVRLGANVATHPM
jgi:hypothetical protein